MTGQRRSAIVLGAPRKEGQQMTKNSHLDELVSRFGNRFVVEDVPD